MDAHHGCLQLQIAQNFTVTSNPLIMQNEEGKKGEDPRLYIIPNPYNSRRTMQTGEPYQGTVICMQFLMVRITIISLFKKIIKNVKPRTDHYMI